MEVKRGRSSFIHQGIRGSKRRYELSDSTFVAMGSAADNGK